MRAEPNRLQIGGDMHLVNPGFIRINSYESFSNLYGSFTDAFDFAAA